MKRAFDDSSVGEIEAEAAAWVARRDAGLTAAEEREFQCWIESDPRHGAAMRFYGSAWSALAGPAQSGKGGELERQLALLAGRRQRRRRRIFAGGAALTLLAGSVAVWNPLRPAPESAPPSAIVSAPSRQVLPDGSVVELKGNARIVSAYSKSLRRITLLEGEAHFAVQRDAARPFVVSAGGVDVRAVGTAFIVQLGSKAVEVLVTEGKVSLAPSPNPALAEGSPASGPLATVAAGSGVVVDLSRPVAPFEVTEIPTKEFEERLAWRSPRLEFTRTPLAEAVALLNQHAPPAAPRLVVADATVAAMRVSGVFRADNTAAFVHLLEGAFEVKAERSGGIISLSKAR
ncbi:MAG: FecR domain-containing protein [Opitutaceae bacterium]|nr:FecR domain-containing protein [Opitutaceae bacterium]